MSLFQAGEFALASGLKANWKIDCDALTKSDWTALAIMLMERLETPFSEVFGVPRGGVPWANALREYCVPHADHLLVVDDVWTTGRSMEDYVLALVHDRAFMYPVDRAVVFARQPEPASVIALFRGYR